MRLTAEAVEFRREPSTLLHAVERDNGGPPSPLGRRAASAGFAAAGALQIAPPRAALGEEIRFATFDIDLKGDAGGSGRVKVKLHPEWAPKGYYRFRKLVERGNFNEAAVFRVVPGFIAQFGLPANAGAPPGGIPDDPVAVSNARGTLTFATSGPDSRSNQLFFNYKDNPGLDKQGFAPIGEVIEGMDIVDLFYSGYKEQPSQFFITMQGNSYLDKEFPKLTKIKAVTLDG